MGGYYRHRTSIKSNRTVVFGGYVRTNEWGHFLLDYSSRLWYCVSHEDWDLVVFVLHGSYKELMDAIYDALELAGISRQRILLIRDDDKPVSFKKIIVPMESMTHRGVSEEMRVLLNRMKENALNRAEFYGYNHRPSRVYFTRSKLFPKKEVGEKEIEAAFKQIGFEIISPEILPVWKQIYIVAHAKEIASIEGSAAHNVLFANQGTRQIILEKKGWENNLRQRFCNMASESSYKLIKAYSPKPSDYNQSPGPFMIGITKELRDWIKKKGNVDVKLTDWNCLIPEWINQKKELYRYRKYQERRELIRIATHPRLLKRMITKRVRRKMQPKC